MASSGLRAWVEKLAYIEEENEYDATDKNDYIRDDLSDERELGVRRALGPGGWHFDARRGIGERGRVIVVSLRARHLNI